MCIKGERRIWINSSTASSNRATYAAVFCLHAKQKTQNSQINDNSHSIRFFYALNARIMDIVSIRKHCCCLTSVDSVAVLNTTVYRLLLTLLPCNKADLQNLQSLITLHHERTFFLRFVSTCTYVNYNSSMDYAHN